MKKSVLILTIVLMVGACAQLTPNTTTVSSADIKTQIKACLTTEAMNRIQDGSAFASPIRTTVKNMTDTCLNKLMPAAEQTPAATTETQQEAKTILTTLLNAASQNR